jgi:hypothetical protein
MNLREELEGIIEETRRIYDEFVRIDNKRKELLNRYYSAKYNICIGESEVFMARTNKKIIVNGFSQDGNIDDKPDIIGRLKLPFGSTKDKTFLAVNWETVSERRGEKEGNFRESDFIPDINGNF